MKKLLLLPFCFTILLICGQNIQAQTLEETVVYLDQRIKETIGHNAKIKTDDYFEIRTKFLSAEISFANGKTHN